MLQGMLHGAGPVYDVINKVLTCFVPGSLFLGVSKALPKYFIPNSCSWVSFLERRSW